MEKRKKYVGIETRIQRNAKRTDELILQVYKIGRKYRETNKSAKEGGEFAFPLVFKSFLPLTESL